MAMKNKDDDFEMGKMTENVGTQSAGGQETAGEFGHKTSGGLIGAMAQKTQETQTGGASIPEQGLKKRSNIMRHNYRPLTDDEHLKIQHLKDRGLALWEFLVSLGDSREVSIAKTKVEEAVLWGTKHLTQ